MLEQKIKEILDMLPPEPDPVLGGESEEYIQHIPEIIDNAQTKFLKLCIDEGILPENYKSGVHRQGIVGRFLDNKEKPRLSRAWYRFMKIDEDYREWQQPYFGFNYEKYKGKGTCVNEQYPKIKAFYRDIKLNSILDNKPGNEN